MHNIGSEVIDYAKFRLEWFTSVAVQPSKKWKNAQAHM
jgi:hypothetical protein